MAASSFFDDFTSNSAFVDDNGDVYLCLGPEELNTFYAATEEMRSGYVCILRAMGKAIARFGGDWSGKMIDLFLKELIQKRFKDYYDPRLYLSKATIEEFMFEGWRAFNLAEEEERIEKSFEAIKGVVDPCIENQFYTVLAGFFTPAEREQSRQIDVVGLARALGLSLVVDVRFEDRALIEAAWQTWREGKPDRELQVRQQANEHYSKLSLKDLMKNIARVVIQHTNE